MSKRERMDCLLQEQIHHGACERLSLIKQKVLILMLRMEVFVMICRSLFNVPILFSYN